MNMNIDGLVYMLNLAGASLAERDQMVAERDQAIANLARRIELLEAENAGLRDSPPTDDEHASSTVKGA